MIRHGSHWRKSGSAIAIVVALSLGAAHSPARAANSQSNNRETVLDKEGPAEGTNLSWIQYIFGADATDPYVDFATKRDNGAGVTSATAGPLGSAANSRTTSVNTGLTGSYAPSYTFQTAANQSLRVGAYFNYGSSSTSYGTGTMLPGFLNVGSMHRNDYSFGGVFLYHVGDVYFGGLLGGNFGDASITDTATASTGNFRSDGFVTMATVGKVFTLAGAPGYVSPTKALPTKAPPKPVDGFALKLDVGGYAGYFSDRDHGYTDSTGFIYGAQQMKTGIVGAQAKLYETWVQGNYTLTPFISASVTQEFGYSNVLNIPTQVFAAANTFSYGSAQTFVGAKLGLDVNEASGITYGVSGYWQQSSEFQVFGGRAYVIFPISHWLGAGPVMSRS
jgi:hypothetical protein